MQINEKKMIEENIFKYEERLKSPLRRFVDKSFIPATYFHINVKKTTVDRGYQDVSEILGENSPIKYIKIEDFPLYDLDQMVLQLQNDDNVLDNTYEGTAVIMVNTIEPLQNDYFILPILKDPYIFRVTGVENDSVSSVRSYRISFILEYIDSEKVQQLYKQTQNEFSCILENIGTEDRCIIEKDVYLKIEEIETMYQDICDTYMTFFYNERYNCFLGDFLAGEKLFDPLQVVFINKHNLFHQRNQLDSLVLTDQFYDNKRKIKYEKSIYRFIERRNPSTVNNFDYLVFTGTNNSQTSFYRWLDRSIRILDIQKDVDKANHYHVLSNETVDAIKSRLDVDSVPLRMIISFLYDKEMDIYDIPLTLNEYLLSLDDANLEVFFFTPIIMYIIRTLIQEFMKKETDPSDIVRNGHI